MIKTARHYRPLRATLVALAAVATLASAGSWSGVADAQVVDPLNAVEPGKGFSGVSRSNESMDQRYSRTGTALSIAQVRQVAIGQTREELLAVLGRPTGQHRNGAWEFQLALPFLENDHLICQYMVFFDGNGLLEQAVWRRPQCADLVTAGLN
ncbi:outer membrane protein assembly factor BamE [Tropicimonas sp. IMCC34011]|uniref:outer membrane protein assembly factor BamE domain-containing protein n=1 Tax=Tropicimonas sp. IMCC34011 TaxID=2248759 RepID=UPI000E280919|nr:outer membrane protein assembly factor BamE [Tropicimonas sp. IMCC34011]